MARRDVKDRHFRLSADELHANPMTATTTGFEPVRAEPSRFRVYPLNRSGKLPHATRLVVQIGRTRN